jgi:hypothetical protein
MSFFLTLVLVIYWFYLVMRFTVVGFTMMGFADMVT